MPAHDDRVAALPERLEDALFSMSNNSGRRLWRWIIRPYCRENRVGTSPRLIQIATRSTSAALTGAAVFGMHKHQESASGDYRRDCAPANSPWQSLPLVQWTKNCECRR